MRASTIAPLNHGDHPQTHPIAQALRITPHLPCACNAAPFSRPPPHHRLQALAEHQSKVLARLTQLRQLEALLAHLLPTSSAATTLPDLARPLAGAALRGAGGVGGTAAAAGSGGAGAPHDRGAEVK